MDFNDNELQQNFNVFCEIAELTDSQKLLLDLLVKQAYMTGQVSQTKDYKEEIERTLTAMETSVAEFKDEQV
jgi:hypothetical protein